MGSSLEVSSKSKSFLTRSLVQNVVERPVGHVVADYYGMGGGRGLTGAKNRQNIWMREDSTKKEGEREREREREREKEKRLVLITVVNQCMISLITYNF